MRAFACSVMLVVGVAGCHHKAPYVLPNAAATAPVALEPLPDAKDPPVIAAQQPVPVPALTPPVQTPRTRRRRPAPAAAPPVAPAPAPPVQVAQAEPPTGAVAIGALSAGGEATPQSQQDARNLIGGIEKRLAALPAKTADAEKDQVRQVRYFLKQAQEALESGDAEGAKTLATKAKLLMDDMEK